MQFLWVSDLKIIGLYHALRDDVSDAHHISVVKIFKEDEDDVDIKGMLSENSSSGEDEPTKISMVTLPTAAREMGVPINLDSKISRNCMLQSYNSVSMIDH